MGHSWFNQKRLRTEKIPSIAEIINIAESIPKINIRALYSLLYITAARIREIIPDRKNNFPSIIKADFSFSYKDDRKYISINIRNEKHKKKKRKEIPFPLDKEENITLWSFIKEYLDTLKLNDELFPFSYQYAYRQLKPHIGGNPHWLRHIRLTHLITVYNFNENLLQRYAGWTDTRPSKAYAELNTSDILDKL